MSLAGIHIAFGYIHAPQNVALDGRVIWSETLTGPGETTNMAAPALEAERGIGPAYSSFEITVAVDAFFATGPAPDPVNGPRRFIKAGDTRQVFCAAGDRVAWTTA